MGASNLLSGMLLGSRNKMPYSQRVLILSPIAYWKLNETSGTVAIATAGANGAYARDASTMTVAAGPIAGTTAPLFDGTNDYVNIYSTGLAAAFNPNEISISCWFKVAAAQWTDGVIRTLVNLDVDNATNYFRLTKNDTSNQLAYNYRSNSTNHVDNATCTAITWQHYCVVASQTSDSITSYLNGIQDSIITPLAAWAGALSNARCFIGDRIATHANPFIGYIAQVAIFAKALNSSQVLTLAKQ